MADTDDKHPADDERWGSADLVVTFSRDGRSAYTLKNRFGNARTALPDGMFAERGSDSIFFKEMPIPALEALKPPTPIPMLIYCPLVNMDGRVCGARHIDEGEFATRPHKTHTCQVCGGHFQQALVPTVGVRFLPGCENK